MKTKAPNPLKIAPALQPLAQPIDTLRPDPANANDHPADNLAAIKGSLQRFGQLKAIVATADGIIRAGNGTWLAAKEMGATAIAVVTIPKELEGQAEEFALADNQAARLSKWNAEKFTALISRLKSQSADLVNLGFDQEKLKKLMADMQRQMRNDVVKDEIPEPKKVAKSKHGDIYELGDHRLMVGDSTDAKDVKKLVVKQAIDAVFTSPPYNVGMKYSKYNDKKTTIDHIQMMKMVLKNCFDFMAQGRILAWNVGVSPKVRPHQHALLIEEVGFDFFRNIVWKKTGAQIPLWQNSQKKPLARNYMPNYNHELIYMASKGNVILGAETTMPEDLSMDVWNVSHFSAGGHDHPAAFPVPLAAMAIEVLTAEGEIVFDPFGGSGSTLIAAEKSKRRACLMEIDPIYCDVIIERWEKFTGRKAEKL